MVNVIGLGYIGLPTALMMATHGVEVVGTDYNEELVDARGRARKVGAITGTLHLPASACFARHQLAPSSAWPQPMPRKPS